MATKRAGRVKRTYQQWHVDPTPTIIEAHESNERPKLGDAEKLRAADAIRKGGPIKMGGTVTRYPDPGGNPLLGVQADDVAVRYGGEPTRNPTAASGLSIAPAANAVVADTGPLPAGAYFVEITLATSAAAAAGKHLQVEHRNAANAATVNTLAGCPGGVVEQTFIERIVLALNERIRAVVGAVAFAASEGAIASIRAYRLDV